MTTSSLLIRPPVPGDFAAWQPLWAGYNAFYGREGPTALPDEITQLTWQRFFDAYEPMHALVAERDGRLVGLTHYLFHRSTTRIEPTCYLQDLFTLPSERGLGAGRQLIQGVYAHVKARGRAPRVLADAGNQHGRTRALRQSGDARRVHRVRHAGLSGARLVGTHSVLDGDAGLHAVVRLAVG
jgi:GNAT superfamily N-acetyltransferase